MCSINGFFSLSGSNDLNKKLRLDHSVIQKKLSYRGPDDSHSFLDNYCGLFSNEFKITNRKNSYQPYNLNNEIIVVFNGEIYNYSELENRLPSQDIPLTERTEAQIIALIYKHFGKEGFALIVGMFAIALYDIRNRELILARDRFGEKPLFYLCENSILHFSSEANALITFTDKKIDDLGLSQYFAYGFSFDHIIKGIKRLKPGYTLSYSNTIELDEYYKPIFHTNYEISEKSSLRIFDELFTNSLNQMIPHETNFGAYISGGIDSSLVTKSLQKNYPQIDLLTSGFIGNMMKNSKLPVDKDYLYVETSGNEFEYSDVLGKTTNGKYLKKTFNELDIHNDFGDMVSHLPGGPVMSTSFPLFYYTAKSFNNYRVCFTGEGADEIFGGYATSQPENYKSSLSNSFIELSDYFSVNEMKTFLGKARYDLLQDYNSSLDNLIDRNVELDSKGLDVQFNKIRYFMLKFVFGTHLLEKADGMTMGKAPTELRMPFLNHILANFIFTLPLEILRKEDKKKYLVYKLGSHYKVPQKIVQRKQKQRTSLPYYSLFFNNSHFYKYIHSVLNSNSIIRDYIKIGNLGEYFNSLTGKRNAHKRIWSLLILEKWLVDNLK